MKTTISPKRIVVSGKSPINLARAARTDRQGQRVEPYVSGKYLFIFILFDFKFRQRK
jgi:hypothetical protein